MSGDRQMIIGSGVITKQEGKKHGIGQQQSDVIDRGEWSEVVQTVVTGARFSVSSGRTVSLGRYEFARLTTRVEYVIPTEEDTDDNREHVFQAAKEFVQEMLDREIAAVRSDVREPQDVRWPDGTAQAGVLVEYGITVNMGRFESAKIDISLFEPVADDETVEMRLKQVQGWVSQRLRTEISKLHRERRR